MSKAKHPVSKHADINLKEQKNPENFYQKLAGMQLALALAKDWTFSINGNDLQLSKEVDGKVVNEHFSKNQLSNLVGLRKSFEALSLGGVSNPYLSNGVTTNYDLYFDTITSSMKQSQKLNPSIFNYLRYQFDYFKHLNDLKDFCNSNNCEFGNILEHTVHHMSAMQVFAKNDQSKAKHFHLASKQVSKLLLMGAKITELHDMKSGAELLDDMWEASDNGDVLTHTLKTFADRKKGFYWFNAPSSFITKSNLNEFVKLVENPTMIALKLNDELYDYDLVTAQCPLALHSKLEQIHKLSGDDKVESYNFLEDYKDEHDPLCSPKSLQPEEIARKENGKVDTREIDFVNFHIPIKSAETSALLWEIDSYIYKFPGRDLGEKLSDKSNDCEK